MVNLLLFIASIIIFVMAFVFSISAFVPAIKYLNSPVMGLISELFLSGTVIFNSVFFTEIPILSRLSIGIAGAAIVCFLFGLYFAHIWTAYDRVYGKHEWKIEK